MNTLWKTGRYGGYYLTLAGGIVQAHVEWSTDGYCVTINEHRYSKIFSNLNSAKLAAEKRIKECLALAVKESEGV